MLGKQKILFVKEEASYGDDPVIAGANAIDARNVRVNYVGDVIERDTMRQDLSPVAPVIGKKYMEISFECILRGSGTTGVAPEVGDLLEGCGFAEALGGSNGSSIIYTIGSATMKSISIEVFAPIDGSNSRIDTCRGARGNVNFKFDAGQLAIAEFTFKGLYAIATDGSTITPSYDTTIPPIVESADFQFNSEGSLCVQAVSLEIANELTDQECVDASAGLSAVLITGRRPSGTFNPEAVTVATYDWWTDWVGATQRALSMNIGSVDYNKIAVSCPKCTIDGISEEDKSGIKTDSIPFKCNRNAGNDEVSLIFS